MSTLLERLAEIEARARALEEQLADPSLAGGSADFAKVGKSLAELRPILDASERYRALHTELEGAKAMLDESDDELRELAKGEAQRLSTELEALEAQIEQLLIPKDPTDARDVILEIRAGAGGEEAALFAAELMRMYSRYAERKGWRTEILSLSEADAGGTKEAILSIKGSGVFGQMKHERGVHRVQRVPATEAQGRIHTSTVTVAVLPEAEEVDIEIKPEDLRIDVFRASGPGGQSVNTTDSAVRIKHLPTGVEVQCQDEKSQHKNKAKALRVLRSRLLEAEQARADAERASERRSQVGTGDRSERIRTYNFPQSRVTDHRAGITLHCLEDCMAGDLDELLAGVASYFAAEARKKAQL